MVVTQYWLPEPIPTASTWFVHGIFQELQMIFPCRVFRDEGRKGSVANDFLLSKYSTSQHLFHMRFHLFCEHIFLRAKLGTKTDFRFNLGWPSPHWVTFCSAPHLDDTAICFFCIHVIQNWCDRCFSLYMEYWYGSFVFFPGVCLDNVYKGISKYVFLWDPPKKLWLEFVVAKKQLLNRIVWVIWNLYRRRQNDQPS